MTKSNSVLNTFISRWGLMIYLSATQRVAFSFQVVLLKTRRVDNTFIFVFTSGQYSVSVCRTIVPLVSRR